MLCVGLHYRLTQPTHFFKKGDRFLGMKCDYYCAIAFCVGEGDRFLGVEKAIMLGEG
jgi:hypothetical protein